MEQKMDLRIRKTYLALHSAFTQLLEERKFEDITVNELCDRAMIRRTTFYKHFADKYEYFTFYIKEIVATFQDRLAPEVAGDDAEPYLLHMSRELLRFIREHERLVTNVKDSRMFPTLMIILLEQIRADIIQVLRRADHGGAENRAKDIEDTAAFYAGGLLSTLFQLLERHEEIEEEHFVSVISKFLV